MHAPVDRLLVCLPDRVSVDALLAASARVAAALQSYPVEIVAAPVHGLHDRRKASLKSAFGDRLDAIHLVPSPEATVDYGVATAALSTLIVTTGPGRHRLPKRLRSPALVLDTPLVGRSVVVVVEPCRDTPATVVAAIALAERLSAPRVVVCHVYFDEGAAACETWEQRLFDEREHELQVFLSRVPLNDSVSLVSKVVQSPCPERTIARVVAAEEALLVVGPPHLTTHMTSFSLADVEARRPTPPTGLHALWRRFLDQADALPTGHPALA